MGFNEGCDAFPYFTLMLKLLVGTLFNIFVCVFLSECVCYSYLSPELRAPLQVESLECVFDGPSTLGGEEVPAPAFATLYSQSDTLMQVTQRDSMVFICMFDSPTTALYAKMIKQMAQAYNIEKTVLLFAM